MPETLIPDRRRFIKLAAKATAAAPLGVVVSNASQLPSEGDLPSLRGATGWLNSPPLTTTDLRGKVVLIDFWTYSCINWRRTLPYIRAWANKYRAHGLMVIGVHTPEFGFENDVDNVRRATTAMNIDYPVAIDDRYAVWRAFNNEYWPALYLVDARGQIRYHKFGEGNYDQSETRIQWALGKAGRNGFGRELVLADGIGPEAAADWANLRSAENYLGYERTENFTSPGGLRPRKRHAYTFPERLKLNHWCVSGAWRAEKQTLVSEAPNVRIAYQFHARDLHLDMGPVAKGSSVRFRVLIDGEPPDAACGVDTNEQGEGIVTDPRMYQLIRQRRPITDRKFEIEFLDPGVQAFSFTFG